MPDPWFSARANGRRIAAGLDDEPIRELRENERRLGGFILPPFQRPPVWTEEQSVKLIESLWEGFPIGIYVVNRPQPHDGECADWLLDGQQRWTAIISYVNGDFPVFGALYPELTGLEQRRFRGITIGEAETRLTDPADCLRVYNRLAYGGTPHDDHPEAQMKL